MEPIAIIGIGCRYPGPADSADAFWKLLKDGVDAISETPEDRWSQEAFFDKRRNFPGKMVTRWGGFLGDKKTIGSFDAGFFGVSPREAAHIDPQHRWMLETTFEAIQDAGIPVETLKGAPVGVYVGISSNDYADIQKKGQTTVDVHTNSGSAISIAANRVSYLFDFRGPSLSVDTACSSALVGLDLACNAIWHGECGMAIAGGVNAILTPDLTIGFSKASMLSPDGRCKAFDASGNGYVRAEGAGALLLKPLSKALADGDRIYCAIHATCVNQDGHTGGMTVPSSEQQEAMLRDAYKRAGIAASEVDYMEAHGTGTPVGDPIELNAIGRVLSENRPRERTLLVGSVKTNIGHLESGSGIAGVIKVALAMYHRQVPPNNHFKTPNPDIEWERHNLRVPTELTPWPRESGVPVASVNSFGFGGTNCHVVMRGVEDEKATTISVEDMSPAEGADQPAIVTLSARNLAACREFALAYSEFVQDATPEDFRAIARTSARRQAHHEHRLAAVANDAETFVQTVDAWLNDEKVTGAAYARIPGDTAAVAFVFTGQGPQWWGMGQRLLREDPVVRATVKEIAALLEPLAGYDLYAEMLRDEERSQIERTDVAQPAIFALQVALARRWERYGIHASTVTGHSVGEVAAAFWSGIYSLEDAVTIIHHRSRLQQQQRGFGRMAAVGVSEKQARELIAGYEGKVAVGAINSPGMVTLAGDTGPLEAVLKPLEESGAFVRWLKVDYAFHTHQMDPIHAELLEALAQIKPQRSRIPYISTVTAGRLTGEELTADYWWKNVRQAVLFGPAIEKMIDGGNRTFLEIGPHPALSHSVKETLAGKKIDGRITGTLRRDTDDFTSLANATAQLYTFGAPIDWAGYYPGPCPHRKLPRYPWQKDLHWEESAISEHYRLAPQVHPILGRPAYSAQPTWDFEISNDSLPYLVDHQINGSELYPGSGYVEIMLAATRQLYPEKTIELTNLSFKKPLFITSSHPVQTTVDGSGQIIIAVKSGSSRDADWDIHATGYGLTRDCDPVEPDSPDTVRTRLELTMTPERFYEHFHAAGHDFGPFFQGVQELHYNRREALGLVSLPEKVRQFWDGYVFHPVLLDGCFQVLRATQPFEKEENRESDGALYLPVGVRSLRIYNDFEPEVYSHVKVVYESEESLVADLRIFNRRNGKLACAIDGFTCQCMDQRQDRVFPGVNDGFFQYKWESADLPEPADAPLPAWVVLGEPTAVARLESYAGAAYERAEPTLDWAALQDPAAVKAFVQTLADHANWQGILFAIDGDTRDDYATYLNASTNGLLHLAQALLEVGIEADHGIKLVTFAAESVGNTPLERPDLVAVRGLARVIMSEQPALRCGSIDLPAEGSFAAGALRAMLENHAEDEQALRGESLWVNRLQRIKPTHLDPKLVRDTGEDTPFLLETKKPGRLENLELVRTIRSEPGPDDVEVKIHAVGLNFRDVLKAMGMYPMEEGERFWFGDECSGIVERVGANVTEFKPGDQVVAVAPDCFGNYVCVHSGFVAHKPEQFSFEEIASCTTVFLTAYYCLYDLGRLQPGESVLIHAASGGVGQAAVQLAKRVGATVFATTSESKRDFVKQNGADYVLNSRTLDFANDIRHITGGKGIDMVLNSLAGEFIPRSLALLKPYGRFLEIGKRDIFQDSKIGLEPFKNNLSFFAVDLAKVLKDRATYLAKLFRELIELFDKGELKPLNIQTFPAAEVQSAFRFMAQGKHMGKIVVNVADRRIPPPVTENEDFLVSANASYVITGGLSGFGLATAEWLASIGARNLVLIGRSGAARPEAQEGVTRLEAAGVTVRVEKADVADRDSLAAALDHGLDGLPRLKGVIHSAMVLDDAFIHQLDAERMAKVLNPKAAGAWNLHEVTKAHPLDFFIMYSSIAALLGSPGQGNYVAANLYLDALADYRRSLGLPALSVNWGALGAAGVVARDEKLVKYLASMGLATLDPKDAFTSLKFLMSRDPSRVAVVPLDWKQLGKVNPVTANSPRFAHLVAAASAGEDNAEGNAVMRARILALPEGQKEAAVLDYLVKTVAAVLGTSPEKIDSTQPLTALGLDSLMAFELKNQIDSDFGINLQLGSMMQGALLSELPLTLLEQVGDAEESSESGGLEPIEEPSATFPLSKGQKALWFLHRLAPESPAYNLIFSARITPYVDIPVMEQAFRELFRQHPQLDVVVEVVDGEPMQTIKQGRTIDFREHDVTALSEEQIKERVVEHASKPFNLATGPVIRLELFRCADGSHITLLSMHHIVSDAWSVALVLNDLIECYFKLRAGAKPELPVQRYRYEDFVQWQDRLLQGPQGNRMLDYWEAHLDGAPNALDLPLDFPRPPMQTFNGSNLGFRMAPELAEKATAIADAKGVTLFNVLFSAYQVMMHRFADQDDIVIGTPLAARNRKEFQNLVGYFVNPVPIRSRFDSAETFADFLDRTSGSVIGALENQEYPFPLLVDKLNIPREPSRSPMVQATFAMERVPGVDEQGVAVFLIGQGGHQFNVADLKVESVDLTLRMAQFEISLVVEEADGVLYGNWQYNADLFDRSTIEGLCALYQQVLGAVLDNVNMPLTDVMRLPESSERELLTNWGEDASAMAFNGPSTVHGLVAEIAAKRADHVAVRCGDEELTYSGLEELANGFAAELMAQGVRPGNTVGVFVGRTERMPALLLGIMKAGAHYLPLDPAFPAARLAHMVADAGPAAIVTDKALVHALPPHSCPVIQQDSVSPTGEPISLPPVAEDALAYVIYTSGSTGKPKGVDIAHGAITNLLQSIRKVPGVTAEDTLLAITTLSFDISLLELFVPLITGATVHVATAAEASDGRILGRILRDEHISIMQATPATWRMLLQSGWEGQRSLKVLCGGEALPRDLANDLCALAGEVWNLYGPTETTVWSAVARVETGNGPVPLGRPVANTGLHIVDDAGKLCPPGISGRLVITGAGLAAGYRNLPELTAERFQTITVGGRTARAYDTGDIARITARGQLEFLGRADLQVKLRGFRIELEDIETVINAQPGIAEAVVTLRNDLPGGDGLVAYLVTDESTNRETLTTTLREDLLKLLPGYMVPGFFVHLEVLPLTPNNKIDRKALPKPVDLAGSSAAFVAPSTPSEVILADIFAGAFERDSVGILENFFELGGDSILAIQILAEVSKAFNVEVPVDAFLRNPTIESLGRYLDEAESRAAVAGTGPAGNDGLSEEDRIAAGMARLDADHREIVFTNPREHTNGHLPKVDAAALAYLPESLIPLSGLSKKELVDAWFAGEPMLTNVFETPLGNISLHMLPLTGADLYRKDREAMKHIYAALDQARACGAGSVSLTGLIPSATGYGEAIVSSKNGHQLPVITTGHATTTATVVLNIAGMLERTGRDLTGETVAILGLGSIGRATVELLLSVLPHPAEVILCDLAPKQARLEETADAMRKRFGYEGKITVAATRAGLPSEVYDASLILGATSVGGILDVKRVRPGTLIVDDSFPPCYRVGDAVERLQRTGDILFTTSGILRQEATIRETVYLPAAASGRVEANGINALAMLLGRNAREITGCILASALTAAREEVRPILGEVEIADSLANFNVLKSLGFTAALPQAEGIFITDDEVSRFRSVSGQAGETSGVGSK